MIRKNVILTAFLFLFVFCLSANAQDTYYIDQDNHPAKFWKEKFVGKNGPGQVGNILMAVGEGWVFQNARLVNVIDCSTDDCPEEFSGYDYCTTYEGGQLTLTEKGEWDEDLEASNMTATNYSTFDGTELKFLLTFSGYFNDGTFFEVEVNYIGEPRVQKPNNPVYQMGEGVDLVGTIDIHWPSKLPPIPLPPIPLPPIHY